MAQYIFKRACPEHKDRSLSIARRSARTGNFSAYMLARPEWLVLAVTKSHIHRSCQQVTHVYLGEQMRRTLSTLDSALPQSRLRATNTSLKNSFPPRLLICNTGRPVQSQQQFVSHPYNTKRQACLESVVKQMERQRDATDVRCFWHARF
jgi:hypothetical protein